MTDIRLINSFSEIPNISDYLISLNLGYPNYFQWVKKCEIELKSGYKKAFYVQKNSQIKGIIIFQPHKINKSILETKTFFVAPENRNQGIGSKLYFSVKQYAINKDFSNIQIDTHNQVLIEFLIKKDFTILRKANIYSPSQIETILQKDLQNIN